MWVMGWDEVLGRCDTLDVESYRYTYIYMVYGVRREVVWGGVIRQLLCRD